jgi:pyruvate kinase
MRAIVVAGVDVFRLNFSHGNHEEKMFQIEEARRIAADLDRPLTILQDLQGPKIRVGALKGRMVHLLDATHIRIYGDEREGDASELGVSYETLAEEVRPGDPIFLDDGLMQLRVVAAGGGVVEAEVVIGGILGEHKGVNLPGAKLRAPALTPKDEEDLCFGLSAGVDMVAMSFVRKPEDAQTARQVMKKAGRSIPLIAKIEKAEALYDIDGVLDAFDGVMVARGDLGVELTHEKVPIAQKRIIKKANMIGKPVITATQMLESMTHNSTPTRAEASDVANAVLDGTDAVMLSGETAIGSYPIETVRTMDRIIREAEIEASPMNPPATSRLADTNAFCSAAARLAADLGVDALAALTRTGGTAQSLSSLRPHMPIFALMDRPDLARFLNLWRGVIPLVIEHGPAIEETWLTIAREVGRKSLLPPGSDVVVVGVSPNSIDGRTDFIRLIRI